MNLSDDVTDRIRDLHDKSYYINKTLSFSRNVKAFKNLQREYLLNNKNCALLHSFYIDFLWDNIESSIRVFYSLMRLLKKEVLPYFNLIIKLSTKII